MVKKQIVLFAWMSFSITSSYSYGIQPVIFIFAFALVNLTMQNLLFPLLVHKESEISEIADVSVKPKNGDECSSQHGIFDMKRMIIKYFFSAILCHAKI